MKPMQKYGIGEKVGVIINRGSNQSFAEGVVNSGFKLLDNGSYKLLTVDIVEWNKWSENVSTTTQEFELNQRTGCYRPLNGHETILTSRDNAFFVQSFTAQKLEYEKTQAHIEAQREIGRKVTAERVAMMEAIGAPRWREYEIHLDTSKMTFVMEVALHDDNVACEDPEGVKRTYTQPSTELVLHVEGRNLNLTLSPNGARDLAAKLLAYAEGTETVAAAWNRDHEDGLKLEINRGVTPMSYL